jgi:hypothetical protein
MIHLAVAENAIGCVVGVVDQIDLHFDALLLAGNAELHNIAILLHADDTVRSGVGFYFDCDFDGDISEHVDINTWIIKLKIIIARFLYARYSK